MWDCDGWIGLTTGFKFLKITYCMSLSTMKVVIPVAELVKGVEVEAVGKVQELAESVVD